MAKIETIGIFGLGESVKGSKFPMSVDINSLTTKITSRTNSLATCPKGTGHDQFLTGIMVMMDMTFSIKAWVEAERYHFLDFVSSQSTMHRISKMNIEKCCNKYVTENTINECKRLLDIYNNDESAENYLNLLYNIPTGFELTARMITNYRCLKTMYSQREHHRLPDWNPVFVDWIYTLPQHEWIICEELDTCN